MQLLRGVKQGDAKAVEAVGGFGGGLAVWRGWWLGAVLLGALGAFGGGLGGSNVGFLKQFKGRDHK